MKVILFQSAKNREVTLAIVKIITGHSCTVEYHDTDKIWNRDYCLNPLALLDQATHMLFVSPSGEKDLLSFFFLAGYCLGRGIRILVLEDEKSSLIPENCRNLCVFLNPESFESFFAAEQIRFSDEERKTKARSALLERGISCFDENFFQIVSSGDVQAASLFLQAGFDPSLADAKGTPLLSLAVRADFPSIVSLLVDAGADVNRQSVDRGYSPLMDAAQKGDAAMVTLLLENGADPNLVSKDGQTALIISAGRGDDRIAELLVSHGANTEIRDKLGMSASSYARLFHNEKLMSLFNTPSA